MTSPDTGLGAGITSFPGIARIASRGNRMATLISAFAFAFSGVSFYETVLKRPKLAAFVPPVMHYARDSGGDIELFAIPVTVLNDGARTGTVLAMELDVTDMKSGKSKRYYSAYLGDHPHSADTTNRSFAPLSIPGRATFSDTVRFYPIGNPLPKLVDDAGDFRFTLTLQTADPSHPDVLDWLFHAKPKPIEFERTLPWISEQQLGFRRATIAMRDRSWNPPAEPRDEPK